MSRFRYICGGEEGKADSGSEVVEMEVTPEVCEVAAAAFSFCGEAVPFTAASSLVVAMNAQANRS